MNIETKITVKKIYNHNLVSKGSKNAQVLKDSCFRVTKLKPVSINGVIPIHKTADHVSYQMYKFNYEA